MSQASQSITQNRLLAVLLDQEYDRLLPHLEAFIPVLKEDFYSSNEPIQYAYFLESGVASIVTEMQDGTIIEVGTVGNEGMVGMPLLLGVDRIPGRAFLQVPGAARRMSAKDFKMLVVPGTEIYTLLHRYLQTFFNQIAQSAACNRAHSLEERFCRWLLMTQDRVESSEILLTQEFLSQMLGVKRPSVNQVAITFQGAGTIRYSRGKITILDRSGLEAAACECYEVVKQEFDRLFTTNAT